MVSLRLMEMKDVVADTPIPQLPVVFAGSFDQCNEYAAKKGYEWKQSRQYLYGGYWHMKAKPGQMGNCLMPT